MYKIDYSKMKWWKNEHRFLSDIFRILKPCKHKYIIIVIYDFNEYSFKDVLEDKLFGFYKKKCLRVHNILKVLKLSKF